MARNSAMALPKMVKLTKRQSMDQRQKFVKVAGRVGNRLVKNALGTLTEKVVNPDTGEEEVVSVEMSSGQIRSAEIILKKAIPDLSNHTVEHKDALEGKSRNELLSDLAELASNPMLLEALKREGIAMGLNDNLTASYSSENAFTAAEDLEINASYCVEDDSPEDGSLEDGSLEDDPVDDLDDLLDGDTAVVSKAKIKEKEDA